MRLRFGEALKDIYQAILSGDPEKTIDCTSTAIEQKVEASQILTIIQRSMAEVGKKFEKGEYFLPEVLCSAESAERAMRTTVPHLKLNRNLVQSRIVVGTVYGDIHDIGKNILVTVLRAAGHDVLDLGTNVSSVEFVNEVRRGADFLFMSALTTTTMLYMKQVIKEIEESQLRKKIIIIVGGGAVTEAFAKEIGADDYGRNAFEALKKVNAFLRKRR